MILAARSNVCYSDHMKRLITPLLCSVLLLSCATTKQPVIDTNQPYWTEKTWTVTDYPGWKKFRFMVLHNPTNRTIGTTVDCNTFISEIVLQPHSTQDILLIDTDAQCTAR